MAPQILGYGEAQSFAPAMSDCIDFSRWPEMDPAPLLLVGAGAVLIQANASARRLLDRGAAVLLRGRALVFTDNQAQHAFMRGLTSVTSGRASVTGVILRGNDGVWRPVEIYSCGPDARERAFVRLPVERSACIDVDPLVQAFALSPAEGEVLRRLVEGLAPKEIARALSISTNTVRAHLRMLYLKMNVRGIPGVIRQTVRLTR